MINNKKYMEYRVKQTTITEKLKQAMIFRNVDLDSIKNQIAEIAFIEIPRNEILLSPASLNQHIYILLNGELNICLNKDGGNVIARINAGESVGEISIIDDCPPSAYVKANQACELLSIHRDVLSQMFERQPELAVNLLKVLGERFRQNNDTLVSSFELQQEYKDKSERDALTGLHNRGWMDEIFPKQLELSQRIGQRVTLAMIDADHFKRVNDDHGHQAGDSALKHLALIIQEHLRETDLLVRYGGEELIVLMPGTILSRAQLVADRIRALVMTTPVNLDNDKQIQVTISIGMSESHEGETIEDLIERADQALYQAKSNGRNRICTMA